jgi:Protein of unknown function (DUF3048) N-terminal domain/Protein of unknown function (DUF3048) C-terminal domain
VRRALLGLLILAVAAAVALYANGRHSPSSSTTTLGATTTVPPVAPLTGLPDPAGQALTRPALTVKVENTPDALPQWGIDRADVVYEEIVNGGITRLAAIFNTQAPAKVGPVRSVRPTDAQVVKPLGGIFAYSGGAPYAVNAMNGSGVKLEDETTAGAAMYRDPARQAPHNLYASAGALFALGGSPAPPRALFTYSSAPWGAGTSAVHSFVVGFPSIYPVTWTWDPASHGWDRTLFGRPIVTGTGVRVSPQNVIVMDVTYVNGVGTLASYANLQGSGSAEVFSQGRMLHAHWSRTSPTSPAVYTTAGGRVIALTPGQTWVELLDTGAPVTLK